MTSTDFKEQRAIIKFCVNLGKTPTQTRTLMQQANTSNSVSRSLVFKWHDRYKQGRSTLEDDGGRGRKRIVDVTLVEKVKDFVLADRRVTMKDICHDMGLSYGTASRILTNELNMHKVCARWIPRLMSEENKIKRVSVSKKFLARFRREGDSFLDRIITTDETWLFLYDPETKEQSSIWKTPASPPAKKARVCKSQGKFMFIFFMDRKGMILKHAVPQHSTVNAAYYSKVFCVPCNFSVILKQIVKLS